jgi:hypothetical protein
MAEDPRNLTNESLEEEPQDGATMGKIVDGIPGVGDRIEAAREQIARGEGIEIDEL